MYSFIFTFRIYIYSIYIIKSEKDNNSLIISDYCLTSHKIYLLIIHTQQIRNIQRKILDMFSVRGKGKEQGKYNTIKASKYPTA